MWVQRVIKADMCAFLVKAIVVEESTVSKGCSTLGKRKGASFKTGLSNSGSVTLSGFAIFYTDSSPISPQNQGYRISTPPGISLRVLGPTLTAGDGRT